MNYSLVTFWISINWLSDNEYKRAPNVQCTVICICKLQNISHQIFTKISCWLMQDKDINNRPKKVLPLALNHKNITKTKQALHLSSADKLTKSVMSCIRPIDHTSQSWILSFLCNRKFHQMHQEIIKLQYIGKEIAFHNLPTVYLYYQVHKANIVTLHLWGKMHFMMSLMMCEAGQGRRG